MNVLFLNPPFEKNFSRGERSPQVAKSRTLYYPVWLAQAAAYIESQGCRVRLIDAVARGLSIQQCSEEVLQASPEVVVVDVSTPSCARDFEMIRAIRNDLPRAVIAMVGPHVAALPKWSLENCPQADVVVLGEYEIPLRNLVGALRQKSPLSDVKGIAHRHQERVMVNQRAQMLENLDDIPFVSSIYKRFLNHRDYFFAAADYPGIMLMNGRGCPSRCTWCAFNQTLHGRKYRHRSPQHIVEEFEYIIEEFPDVKELWIDDETFTADKGHLNDVCRLIVQKRLRFRSGRFKWYCNARPPLNLDSLKLMKQAGCRLIVVGFESGSPELLKNMHKGYTIEKGLELMANTRKAGLLVHGCFMVGNIGETRETMQMTLDYAHRLSPDSAQFYFVHPYPGTEYYQWALNSGALTTEDYSQWLDEAGQHRCVLSLPGLSAQEIEDFCNNAYREYHLSKKYLLKKGIQLFSQPREGVRSLKAGVKYFRGGGK